MNHIEEVFERIQVIRGVSKGFISHEQIKDIVYLYGLNEEQKQELFKLLDSKGICPISEDKFPKLPKPVVKGGSVAKIVEIKKEQKTKATIEKDRKEIFYTHLLSFVSELKQMPVLIPVYIKKFEILKAVIVKYAIESRKNPYVILTEASTFVGNYQFDNKFGRYRVCGRCVDRGLRNFERKVRFLFTERELTELIQCCMDKKDLTPRQEQILMVLLRKAPRFLVSRRYRDYLE